MGPPDPEELAVIDVPATDEDPWAWLHAHGADDGPDWAQVEVIAVVQPLPGVSVDRCRTAVEAGVVAPDRIVVDDPLPGLEGEWLWLLPADCEPAPDALRRLLVTLARRPELDVIGPLLVEPRRRSPATVVRQFGQTITSNGRVRSLVAPGELYQGQLQTTETLGVPADGMLVRGEVWRELGGFVAELPATHRGVEFCWRATLAGHRAAAEPDALVASRAEPVEVGDARAAGLAVVGAHLRPGLRWLGRLRLVVMSLLASIGYALGKDGERAAGEVLGLGRWIGRRRLRKSVAHAVRAVPGTPATRARVRSLRPRPGSGLRRFGEGVADRVSDWFATFTGPSEAPSLDEMTGDDFAGSGRSEPRVSALVAGGILTVVMAVTAGRLLFGGGSLRAERLLPAPSGWLDLMGSYLDVVPGGSGLSGPAWTGLAAIGSFVTLGQPEWLVTLVLMGCVPLAWFGAFRFLRQNVQSVTMAGVGAFCYAIAPALVGALNIGSVGVAAWTVLLPVFGYGVRLWLEEPLWRRAAAVCLSAIALVALLPAGWAVLVPLAFGIAVRGRRWRIWGQAVLVAAAPLLLVAGPWRDTLIAYPGRLLTGLEPSMAGTAAAEGWEVLLGRSAGNPPPLWLSIVVMAGLWLVAAAGALRLPGKAAAAFAVAGGAMIAALVLTRALVWVPPGEWARPAALEWLVVAIGALVLAAAWGLDGVGDELRDANLGLRHFATLGIIGTTVVVVVLAGGWWVVAGQTGLSRGPVSALPPFVRNAQVSDTPGRTLALEFSADAVGWSLLQDDLPRLGDAERGLVFSGDPDAARLAASVASRLAAGTADDELSRDLRILGVSYIWLLGGDAAHRLAISNTPGLGVGTTDGDTAVWPVPESGRAVVTSPTGREVVGDGVTVSGGTELELAEPADPRWQVAVGERSLTPLPGEGPGQSFALAGASGTLSIGIAQPIGWWVWVQAAGLALLALLAAPGLRRGDDSLGPRRVEVPVARHPEAPAPRRAAGGGR